MYEESRKFYEDMVDVSRNKAIEILQSNLGEFQTLSDPLRMCCEAIGLECFMVLTEEGKWKYVTHLAEGFIKQKRYKLMEGYGYVSRQSKTRLVKYEIKPEEPNILRYRRDNNNTSLHLSGALNHSDVKGFLYEGSKTVRSTLRMYRNKVAGIKGKLHVSVSMDRLVSGEWEAVYPKYVLIEEAI